MSALHPVMAIVGPSGAGGTSVLPTCAALLRRLGARAAYVSGDAFRRYDRTDMRAFLARERARGRLHVSHFGPEANLFAVLEALFRDYGVHGSGCSRHYVRDAAMAVHHARPLGTFTPWTALAPDTDLLIYEGLHGAVRDGAIDVGRHADLLIGVVPIINLEWMEKLVRDRPLRGGRRGAPAHEDSVATILRQTPDYVHYVVPQFSRTHLNIQQVPLVDTANPFAPAEMPTTSESLLVVRYADPAGVDFPYLLAMIRGSFMSRPNTLVCPGGQAELALQLILRPLLERLLTRRRAALAPMPGAAQMTRPA